MHVLCCCLTFLSVIYVTSTKKPPKANNYTHPQTPKMPMSTNQHSYFTQIHRLIQYSTLLLLLLHTKVWCKIPLLSHHGYAMALHHHHDDVKALHGHGDHVKKPTWHRKAFIIKRFFSAASGDRTRDLPSHSLVS